MACMAGDGACVKMICQSPHVVAGVCQTEGGGGWRAPMSAGLATMHTTASTERLIVVPKVHDIASCTT